MKAARSFIDTLLYSNIFIGLCALALTLTNQLTIDGEIRFDRSSWFVFFATIFTYSWLKIHHDTSANPSSTTHRSWASENQQLSKNLMLISLISALGLFLTLPRKAEFVIALLAAVTLFYGSVKIPFTNPPKKLRDYGLLKTLFVGIVWAVMTVIVPMAGEDVPFDMKFFLLLRRCLFVMALTMVFEIKDMRGDREHGLQTIPLSFGVSNTKLLAQIVLLFLIVINLVQYFLFDLSLSVMLAVTASLIVSIVCIQPVNEDSHDAWYYFVLDGMMILQFLFVYGATSLFT